MPRKPMLPGTSSSTAGTWTTCAGRSSQPRVQVAEHAERERADQHAHLAAEPRRAERDCRGSRRRTPATIQPNARSCACTTTATPIEDATSATQCAHSGSGDRRGLVNRDQRVRRARSPSATPTTSSSSTITADIRRAVPAIRLRVASSVIATVSDMPGNRMISAATVTSDGVTAATSTTTTPAANAANAAPTSSNTRA